MTDASPILDANTATLRVAAETADLATIYEEEAAAVALRRTLSPALREAVEGLVRRPSFAFLEVVTPDEDALRRLQASLPAPLAEDVHVWCDVLGELAGVRQIGVRLARLDVAMCPWFHFDRVWMRMLCTYVGAGTEIVERAEVAVGCDGGLVLGTRATVRRAACGDVVVLKGEAWGTGSGAIHRSPTISRERPRLVMTLDPL